MLHRVTVRLLSRRHTFSTSGGPTEQAADDLFTAAWRRIVPNLDPPKTPLAFVQPRPSMASKLTINMVSQSSSGFSNKQADLVIVPATTGQMGILPGHVSSISELKPGLLSIHEGNEVTNYFVSSGFAFVHSNSVTDIIAVEAVPTKQVDPASVQKALAEYTQKLNTASTDMEKAEAQVAVDVLSALNSSLSE
ncbi:hypothetical protein DH2020_046917 [Rehmannia glutinosa]|uniref:ATP synthase F1 complex delta/epsilon subunit N-terminal domain-containing protein n=1 Tax=Rehmannia glutinosa TaxID=99300 RepID=A0ABR0UAZ6_REHGL